MPPRPDQIPFHIDWIAPRPVEIAFVIHSHAERIGPTMPLFHACETPVPKSFHDLFHQFASALIPPMSHATNPFHTAWIHVMNPCHTVWIHLPIVAHRLFHHAPNAVITCVIHEMNPCHTVWMNFVTSPQCVASSTMIVISAAIATATSR